MHDLWPIGRLDVSAPVALWAIDLRIEPAHSEVQMLDASERARYDRFYFECDRRRYRAAHVALRRLLAHASGIAMPDLRFAIGAYGKPMLRDRPSLAFNMSFAADIALIGIGEDGSVGVDVETRRQIDDLEALAEGVFVNNERIALMAAPLGPTRDAAFLHGWTRKEACIKALGTGLSGSLDFAAGVDGNEPTSIVFAESGRAPIQVGSFLLGPMFIGAWARLI